MNGFKVTTKVIFNNSKDEILLLKKENNPSLNWDLPGGTLEISEQINEGIVREIAEELSIDIDFSDLTLFNVYVVNRVEKPSLLVIVYVCNKEIENIVLSDEHTEYLFANNSKIDSLKEDSIIFKIVEDFNDKNK